MDDSPNCDAIVGACGILIAIVIARRRKKRRNRKVWVRDWIRDRPKQGAYHQLLQELRLSDARSYRNFLRMDQATFDELLSKVGPLITYKDTFMRKAISPGERLALTLLCFLATGEHYLDLHYFFTISLLVNCKYSPCLPLTLPSPPILYHNIR